MNADDYCGFHTAYYFIIAGIGMLFVYIGNLHPVYNTDTGEVITPYSLPFIVFGACLIFFAFIGLLFFAEDKDNEPKETN